MTEHFNPTIIRGNVAFDDNSRIIKVNPNTFIPYDDIISASLSEHKEANDGHRGLAIFLSILTYIISHLFLGAFTPLGYLLVPIISFLLARLVYKRVSVSKKERCFSVSIKILVKPSSCPRTETIQFLTEAADLNSDLYKIAYRNASDCLTKLESIK